MAEPGPGFRPLPKAEGLAGIFLDGVAVGRLLLQHCAGCDQHWHYPRPVCPRCGGRDWDWADAAGTGCVHSVAIVHRAPIPSMKALTPYALAMIDLDEGARITSILVGEDALDAAVGDPVQVAFPKDAKGEPGMPVFRRMP